MMPGEPPAFRWDIERSPAGRLLRAELVDEARCLSSAVYGGGLGRVRTWVNLQVAPDYGRTDPEAHLAEATSGFAGPVVGMLTAAKVDAVQDITNGAARVLATVGLGHPTAAAVLAATGHQPPPAPAGAPARVGTINVFAVVAVPLTEAGLAGAFITAVEAKAQALAAAGVQAANAPGWATGTASDALVIACPPPAEPAKPFAEPAEPFAGPATPHGADLARAVFEAVLRGCRAWRER